ncbi:hypothetical protein QQY66_31855 [Streptomyces sp. DG2A-72]|uniref:hypothetical protein n=1 Tax=Streptomyces sp. DG2A-72 TaxID=3051386 RepID=UPI00265BBFA5|nr:hypothetical protein [Streptomyces sp. DG2A-72]MDO0936071.1 hypothetical protein [Streptomyces sp. DG2A-72]
MTVSPSVRPYESSGRISGCPIGHAESGTVPVDGTLECDTKTEIDGNTAGQEAARLGRGADSAAAKGA